jgi:dihydrolipoamide dehydrogenase
MPKYDIAIIGSGPGGYVAAIRAAQFDKKVCIVEKEWVGGTCLNIGCIPTKALISSAEMLDLTRRSKEFGVDITGEVGYSLERIMQRKKTIVTRCVKGVEYLLKAYNIDVKWGRGELVSPGEIKVKDEEVKADVTIIATGSEPKIIRGMEPDGKTILTSRDALEFRSVPDRFLVVGAGVIGIEMATLYNLLGAKVAVVEMLDSILPTLYSEKMSKTLAGILKKRGIEILTSTTIQKVDRKNDSVSVSLSNSEEKEFDRMLVSVGRYAHFDGIDAAKLGIELKDNFIKTDASMKTNVDGVYAIGDVCGGMLLAHKASREGIVAVDNICGFETEMTYHAVPSCIFSHPPAALVGITESMAKEQGIDVRIGEYNYAGNARAHSLGERDGYARIIADRDGTVIGGEIVGGHADSMISQVAMACELKLNLKDMEKVIYPHPTLGEVVQEAMHDAEGRAIHKPPQSGASKK